MKYIVYYRVSTKGQGESGLGLESQHGYIHHYLKPEQIVHEATEVISGKIPPMNRPMLRAVLQECLKHGYGLAIAKIDRLGRITEDALSVFNSLDGKLFACDIPTKPGMPMDKFTLTIFMAIAERERELISIRTKDALASLKAKGKQLGTPDNLSDDARTKAIQAIKAKAQKNENNRRAKDAANDKRKTGKTLQVIANELNAAGYQTARGKSFTPMQVSRLLI